VVAEAEAGLALALQVAPVAAGVAKAATLLAVLARQGRGLRVDLP